MDKRVEEGRPKVVLNRYTLDSFDERFPDEDACKQYVMQMRWPDGVKCPRCKNPNVYKLNFKPWHWQCRLCQKNGYRFSGHHARRSSRTPKSRSRLGSRSDT